MGKIIKIKGAKAFMVPKHQCRDFDSACLTMDENMHLGCFVHEPSRGYCPFVSRKVKYGGRK